MRVLPRNAVRDTTDACIESAKQVLEQVLLLLDLMLMLAIRKCNTKNE